jgi:hypothetical protein
MGTAHCGYPSGVTSSSEPIHQLGPDRPALGAAIRSINRARTAGDHQHQSRALRMGQRQPMFQPAPRRVERMAMQIEGEIRQHRAFAQAAIPIGVKAVTIERA